MQIVVILGAGWAGLPLAHKLLKYSVPKNPTGLKVILVSPNSHFFWNIAGSRGIIPNEISDEELFIPIEPAFARYPAKNFEFVLGRANGVKPNANKVELYLNDGARRDIQYDHLVIATGSRLKNDIPLKLIGSHEATIEAWHDLQSRIKDAKSIIVSGGGATGIEVAGELASKYGTAKAITLLAGAGDLLPQPSILPSLRSTIEKDLQKLSVKVVKGSRVNDVTKSSDGKKTELVMSDESTLTTDLYIPFHGIELNTSFLPQAWLDEFQNVKLDRHMHVSGTKNVWGIGDIGNLAPKQLTVTDDQIIHLSSAIDAALSGGVGKSYQLANRSMIFLSLGKSYGTGQIGNWRLWGFIVNYAKGRKLFVDTAKGYVAGEYLRHAKM